MSTNYVIGIDIGGTYVKCGLFADGELLGVSKELDTPGQIEVIAFCEKIMHHLSGTLSACNVRWDDIDGVGISWPGGVRDNRVVATSGVLAKLFDRKEKFGYNDHINRLPTLSLLDKFRTAARSAAKEAGQNLKHSFEVGILNDGDAEALGNYSLRVLERGSKAGGMVVVKLGTSIAGGRIQADGAVARDVAEFAKLVINLNAKPNDAWPDCTARQYTAAAGVRFLTRKFEFQGETLFGERDGLNLEESSSRIEPDEIGRLLELIPNGLFDSYLLSLVSADNKPGRGSAAPFIAAVEMVLRGEANERLRNYINSRGTFILERCLRSHMLSRHRAEIVQTYSWEEGVRRIVWLCGGSSHSVNSLHQNDFPHDFPFAALATTIAGVTALFSQISLQMAMILAQLYNVYRRNTFSEIILSGGVLSGRTGEIVETQTKRFMLKYFDKIYGREKYLTEESIIRVTSSRISNPGMFGAAMAMNRVAQVREARTFAKIVHAAIEHAGPGEIISIADFTTRAEFRSFSSIAQAIFDDVAARGNAIRTGPDTISRVVSNDQ